MRPDDGRRGVHGPPNLLPRSCWHPPTRLAVGGHRPLARDKKERPKHEPDSAYAGGR
uniref:Uncharacterized protein n=1 Tax=uncultured marine virus TaxID=186617 RepID=A0A0F7L6N6_9VIRU|nr:hypothetical protein [uncultured marine virus]